MRILTADIGGTKSRFALATREQGRLQLSFEQTYPSRDYSALQEILGHFLRHLDVSVDGAALGLPGPVRKGRCEVTNLPWVVDADEVATGTGIPTVVLLNDLEATAWGIDALADEDFLLLQQGDPSTCGNRAVIAAGTGLGEAGMYWGGDRHYPFPGEGGHCDFSPRDDLEMQLMRWLRKRYRQVSWERVVSGPGLVDIYGFLTDYRKTPTPDWLEEQMRLTDPAEAISRAADIGKSPVCRESLELFCGLYGAEAGNLALKMMATGGLYIGGGIAPKIIDWLQRPAFLGAFHDKGKMRGLMKTMPVRVILNDRAALLGPAVKLISTLEGIQ